MSRRTLSGILAGLAMLVMAACDASYHRAPDAHPSAKYPNPNGPVHHGSAQDAGSAPATPNNTEQYTNYGVNPWTDTSKDALSTFAIDVDTASYTIARRKINEGVMPPADSVRPEEFLNFFNYKYEGPTKEPFQIHVGGAISPFNDKHHFLRIALQGKRVDEKDRKTAHLTLLVDTSCSMSSGDKLALVKESLNVLIDNLRGDDTVAVATYAGSTRAVLQPTPISEKDTIKEAINRLRSGGGTAMASGMKLAYDMALKSYVKGHINRVIVLSDGDANIGSTSHGSILKSIEEYVKKGITMTTVGYGMGNYKDTRMEQLANKGNGNYYYVDTLKQAKRIFGKALFGTLQVIAKDVKIQVEFNSKLVQRYRLIGYENRAIADKDFRNDAVDAGELGAGHVVTALYELQLKSDLPLSDGGSGISEPLVNIRLRHKKPDEDKASEMMAPVMASILHRPLAQADWTTRWALAVAAFAEILRKSQYAKDWQLSRVRDIAKAAMQEDDADHSEFLGLVDKVLKK